MSYIEYPDIVARQDNIFCESRNKLNEMDKLFELESNQEFENVLRNVINIITYCTGINKKTEDTQITEQAAEDVRKLIFNCNFDMKKVQDTVAIKNWDKDRIKCFISLIAKENTKLLYASIIHHISGYGETITQSDWILKLVLGTSELNTLKYPLLLLNLLTVDSNGVQSKRLCEFNKDMVMKTIEALEIITKAS